MESQYVVKITDKGQITLPKELRKAYNLKEGDFNQVLGVKENKQPERKVFGVGGSAAFVGDRLAGWLNEEESMGAMFIVGKARSGDTTKKIYRLFYCNSINSCHLPRCRQFNRFHVC